MKLLTVDYEPRHARRVTIPVPDDVDMDNLDPYDWYEEIADAVERGDGRDLETSDDELTVVSLNPAPEETTRTVHLVYTATLGTEFDATVPAGLEGAELEEYIQDHWGTLVDPHIGTADLDTIDTSLEFGR